jgi:hypothetical protein
MKKKSIGAFALVAILIGGAGLGMTGCGLDTPTQVPLNPDSTDKGDTPTESVVPIERSGISLELPGS